MFQTTKNYTNIVKCTSFRFLKSLEIRSSPAFRVCDSEFEFAKRHIDKTGKKGRPIVWIHSNCCRHDGGPGIDPSPDQTILSLTT